MQFMKNVKIINYMKRSAWMFPCRIAPSENGQCFLYEKQIKPVGRKSVVPLENNYHTITSNYSHCPTSRKNFIMNPKELFRSYRWVIWWRFGREKFRKKYDFDNLGSSLNEDKSVSDYDKATITEFENSIHNKNSAYYVDLPWLENKMKKVPSNCPVENWIVLLEKLIITLKVKTW